MSSPGNPVRFSRQTQVNGCRIHREQLGFEPVAMSRRLRLAAPQQSPVQLLVHLPRLLGVHPRERRPRHHADPQVVEFARLCGKIRDDVPQAAASCQLGHPHRHELAPAGHAPRHPTRLVLACEALELMSRYELEYLREYGIIVGHGLGSPVFSVGFDKPIIPAQGVPGPFSYGSSGTAVIRVTEHRRSSVTGFRVGCQKFDLYKFGKCGITLA